MNPFVNVMVTPAGRIARAVAGIAIIAAGLGAVGGSAGLALAAVGLVPLAAGAFDICVFAPLFHLPLGGAQIRHRQ